MNTVTESAAPHHDEELLGELMRQLSQTTNVEAVLEKFCQRHPHLEVEARSYPRMQQMLQGVHPVETPHPRQLGDFRIIRQMARGGMGVIYEAIQERLKRRVVLKTMKASWDVGPARLRFRREQEVLARLHQTHIVPIHTADEAEGLHYFVMPYIEGASLNHVVEEARNQETSQADSATASLPAIAGAWLKKSNTPEVEQPVCTEADKTTESAPVVVVEPAARVLPMHYFRSVAEALADVAEGLHYAHQEGLLHRDLKPSNIMIEPNGKSWIIDFGLAGFLHQTETVCATTGTGEEAESLTHGHTIGTPAYMAPEQWATAGPLDVRTDVWGLGVTLYEMLTLQRAFSATSPADTASQQRELRQRIEQAPPRPPTELVRNVPSDLAAICAKAMKKDPRQRYATAQAFAEDLRRWLRCEPTTALPGVHRAVWFWARRNTGWAFGITMLLATLLCVLGIWTTINAQQSKQLSERERTTLIQEQQRIRLLQHEFGWSEEAWKKLVHAHTIRQDDELRDQFIASLVGVDANVQHRFPLGASSVAFDATGKKLLIGGLQAQGPTTKTRIWDGSSTTPEESGLILSGPVAFDPQGTPLQAVTSGNWILDVWDVSQNRRIATFKHDQQESKEPIYNNYSKCDLSSDGSLAALYSPIDNKRGMLTVWDRASRKPMLTQQESITSLKFSKPHAGITLLAAGTHQGKVILWELPSGRKITEFTASHVEIQSLAFGKDVRRSSEGNAPRHPVLSERLLAVGTHAGEITVWRPAFEKLVNTYRGSQYDIYALAFSPDGATLASGGRADLRIWDVATAQLLLLAHNFPYTEVTQYLKAMEFSPDGARLVVGNQNPFNKGLPRAVYVLNILENRGVRLLRGLDSASAKILYSPQGRYLAALSETWQVGIWDAVSGQLLHLLDVPVGFFTDNAGMAFSLDDREFAFIAGGQAKRWEISSGKLLNTWKDLPPALQEGIAFHPTGALLCGRSETQDKKYPPTSNFVFEQHPRVYRVRDLLSKEYEKPLYEIADFNIQIQDSCFGPEGAYLLIHGVHGTRENRAQTYRAVNALNGKLLWNQQTEPRIDNHPAAFNPIPSGKLVQMDTPINKKQGEYVLMDTQTWKVVRQDSRGSFANFSDGQLRTFIDANGFLLHSETNRKSFRIPMDRRIRETCANFDKSGQFLSIGTYTGEVVQVNLPEIRRRLQQAGFAWPLAD